MAASFPNPNSDSGLKKLDEHFLTRDYITGNQASKDDKTVFTALAEPPSSQYVNASRWYNHIDTLMRNSGVFAEGSGVIVEGSVSVAEEAVATPPAADDSKGGKLLSIEPLVLVNDMKGKSSEEISQTICNINLNTLFGSLKETHKKFGRDDETFCSVVVQHLNEKSEEEISQSIRYEHLSNFPELYNVATCLSLNTLSCALNLHLETQKSRDELSQILLKGELMDLIQLIQMSLEQSDPSQLYNKCTTHIDGKSNEELKEAILNLDLKDLIQIVEVCKRSGSMDKLLKVVVDHLVGKSREDLSKMVSTKCGKLDRGLLLDEAEKTLRVYQVKFFRETNKATNDKFLKKWKKLFKAVVLPKLEDEGLIRFRIACRGASRLVDSEIRSRYISLRRKETKRVSDFSIKLENDYGFSVNVSLRGSLESGILCAERVKNIENYGMEHSITQYMYRRDNNLLEIASGYCEAASSEDANALAIWAVNLENAGNQTLLEIMSVAQELEMKGLLLKTAEYMAQRLKDSTQDWEIRQILGFPHGSIDDDDDDSVDDYYLDDSRPFLKLMIPMLDDESYIRFARMGNACAVLVNEVQARKCFRAGQEIDPWKISLSCTNGKKFMASEAVIALSGLIKNKQLEDPLEDSLKIDLQYTTEEVLRMIHTYCAKHATDNVSDVQLRRWDEKFLRKRDANTLLSLAQAAVEMEIKTLVDLVSQSLAAMINNKAVREMRASFELKYDLTPYAERKWRQKHDWAFELDPLSELEEEYMFGGPLECYLTIDYYVAHMELHETESEESDENEALEDTSD